MASEDPEGTAPDSSADAAPEVNEAPECTTDKKGTDDSSRGAKKNKKSKSDVDAVGSPRAGLTKSKGRKGKKDGAPAIVQRSTSVEDDGDDDIIDDDDDSRQEAWKMRESWKSSAHSESDSKGSKGSKEGSTSRRGRKKDSEPAMPRRSRAGRPDADEDMDQPPAQPKVQGGSKSDEEGAEPGDDAEKSKKPKRRSGRSGSEDGAEVEDGKEDLEGNSFHRLAKDFDKPSRPRSTSRGKKTKAPGSASGRRRRLKDRALDHSGHDDDDSEVYGEFGEEEHEVKLKDDAAIVDPGSGGSRSRMSWRERRARNRLGEDPSGDGPDHAVAPLKAPGSGGRRPPRRGMMRRASSERWKRAVEGEDDPEAIQNRARATLRDANAELSRSAHSIRRYHSGGVGAMSSGLDARSYHGPTEGRRPPLRTPRKQIRGPPPDSADSGGSFGNDYDDYDLNLSGRSARTLDSIEDLEDFEHMDFQTPGMVDYDEEILDLMQRANPENTAQLNRRVHRKREAVNYDQNMPMMTRQALLTRQASAQVARQRFDGSNIDRQRLLLRSDSMSSADGGELSMSNHRPMRTTPGGGRRPPPRTRSSGMAAMAGHAGRSKDVPGFMQQAPTRSTDPENRRGVFRTRSSTASFKQYHNKPNRVASLSRRGPGTGEQIDPHSMRGSTSASSAAPAPADRRGSLQRAKSTTALRPSKKLDPRGDAADHEVAPRKKEEAPARKSDSDDERRGKKKQKEKAPRDDESLNSESEDSDVESIEEEEMESPKKPARRKPTKPVQPKSPIPIKAKKSTDKRDMLVKRNRCKLHAMMYEVKMGVDMKDLFVEVQKGEIPKSPIKALMMPSP
mmetsp:Transcript_117906/g.176124  ORF Transcript_117906/g.176124 Transcript_117906/m.176124 type:complete len:843 (-) Transcript_117906:210-2738(-)